MMTVICNPNILKSVPLFSTLTDSDLAAMLPTMQQRAYPARSCILRAGESSDALYVVLSGRVRVLLDDGEGHEIIVAAFGPTDFFGEIEVMDGGPRLATFDCPQATEILQIPRKAVVDWLERDSAAAMLFVRTMARRPRVAARRRAAVASTRAVYA